MSKFGDKAEARKFAVANDVPVLPGSDGPLNEVIDAVDVDQAGPPVAGDNPAGPPRETPAQGDPGRADTDTQSPPYSASAD